MAETRKYCSNRMYAHITCEQVSQRGSNLTTEIRAGITTFLTAAYIMAVACFATPCRTMGRYNLTNTGSAVALNCNPRKVFLTILSFDRTRYPQMPEGMESARL